MIDRCVCHDVTFARLSRLARRHGLGFEQLSVRTGCATSCGLCAPYIHRMLATGRTDFAPCKAEVNAEATTARPIPTPRST